MLVYGDASHLEAGSRRHRFAARDAARQRVRLSHRAEGAVARFGEVRGVTEAERAQAFANIKAAAGYYGVNVKASSWHDLVA
jgi:hypothetical protein